MKNKNIFYKILLIILANIIAFQVPMNAQNSKFGSDVSPHGTIRVLVVFVELTGGCGDLNTDPGWPSGPSAPQNADLYLDAAVSNTPIAKLTKYYKDISLGELNVIGDYFDRTVQLACPNSSVSSAISQLQTELNNSGITTTKHGYSLNDFDLWTNTGQGIQKPNVPDGNIDATVVLWRNSGFSCGSGYGVGNYINQPLLNKTVTLYGTWDGCPSTWLTSYDGFFVQEFFHALMGGNNFHTGGGDAYGSFIFDATGSYSTSAQSGSVSNIVCGWDRNYLDWRGVGASQRQYPISALNLANQEVVSDISVATNPSSSFFILRDFVTVGDAIRIKLPHFNWQASGDRKNQYLWIENHQVGKTSSSEFDHNKTYNSGCGSWVPGIYVQLEAGKDLISGPYTYGYGGNSYPNDLNDWLFPLHKEGNWDYYYDIAHKHILPNINCGWNGKSVPYSIQDPSGNVLPNPLTGYNDVYGLIDSNDPFPDGSLIAGGDFWQPRYEKWPYPGPFPVPGSPPTPTLPQWGDNLDGFTGVNTKISIATNPAPMPVYTLRQANSGTPGNWENRTISLNNVAITIIDDDYYNAGSTGMNAYLIRIDWDESTIDNDARWCGNIVLENDLTDPALRLMQIDLAPNKTLTLDRGISPTKLTSSGGFFTDETCLHLLNGTATTLESNSALNVINGSTLHIQTGAILIIGPGASVNVDATSAICIEPGSNIIFQDPASSKIVVNSVSYYNYFLLLGVVLQNTTSGFYHAYTDITTGSNGLTPTTMTSNGLVECEAGSKIKLGLNTHLQPVSNSNKFHAHINFPSNCNSVCAYQLRVTNGNGDYSAYNFNDPVIDRDEFYDRSQNHVENKIEKENIIIYPNPTFGEINIKINDGSKLNSVKVYNVLGLIVTEKYFNSQITSEAKINLNGNKEGIYYLQIYLNDQLVSKKVILCSQ